MEHEFVHRLTSDSKLRSDSISAGRTWRKIWPSLLVLVGVIILIVQGIRVARRPQGDFPLHWESGRRIVAAEPLYAAVPGGDPKGHNHPYPPFWAFAHAPVSLLPMHTAQLLCYPLFALSFWILLQVLKRMTRGCWPLDHRLELVTAAVAGFLASRYLMRDMLECGINLVLVTLSWLALWLWQRDRDRSAGWVLGLAISLKCTPALFAAYFVWKRQWRVAAWTAAATVAFTVSPMLWMGPGEFVPTLTRWFDNAVVGGLAAANGVDGVLGDEPLQNMSLKPAVTRLLVHLPPGHVARLEHPAYFEFLSLSPAMAGWIARLALVGILAIAAWRFRGAVIDRQDGRLVWEFATVSVLILLLSPITWGQHCVGLFPAFYLLKRMGESRQEFPRWMNLTIWSYIVCVIVLNRAVLGQELSLVVDSYRLQTWFIVGVFAMLLSAHRQHPEWIEATDSDSVSVPFVQPSHSVAALRRVA